ncbi:MAG TPA: hypothetical protein VMS75_01275 [Terriglobales bacterium]|nr:hypothetical protein [Terriglobales bacterium]
MEAPTEQSSQVTNSLRDGGQTWTSQDSQVRKGEPKHTIWADEALAAKP